MTTAPPLQTWVPMLVTTVVLTVVLLILSQMAMTVAARAASAYRYSQRRNPPPAEVSAAPVRPTPKGAKGTVKAQMKARTAKAQAQHEEFQEERWQVVTRHRRAAGLMRTALVAVFVVDGIMLSLTLLSQVPAILACVTLAVVLVLAARFLLRSSPRPLAGASEEMS